MKNRVTVNIGEAEYTIIAEESEEYIRSVAGYYDVKLKELRASCKGSMLMAAVLAGVNVSDEYFKVKHANESLRVQIKEYLEEIGRLKAELAEGKRELDSARGARR